ncbi:MAG: hypothetical protein ABFD49_07165 [Armatimonadota bacterium]|nr:hypothetical protein [bacterium]
MTQHKQIDRAIHDLKSGAHWRVVVRPDDFDSGRISELAKCEHIVASSQVNWRGWPYPFFDSSALQIGSDWIACFGELNPYREYWRYYQSGQFAHLFGFREEWYQKEAEIAAETTKTFWHNGYEPQGYLDLTMTINTITEIFEFAARLAISNELGDNAHIKIELVNAKDRLLINFGGWLLGWYRIPSDNIKAEWSGNAPNLSADSAQLALDAAKKLLQQLRGRECFDAPISMLAEKQRELRAKGS